MRNIQEIFNLMINCDLYNVYDRFMCVSLGKALQRGLIKDEEYEYVMEEIREYVGLGQTLNSFLESNSFTCINMSMHEKYAACLPIYQDWANRPMKENNA